MSTNPHRAMAWAALVVVTVALVGFGALLAAVFR